MFLIDLLIDFLVKILRPIHVTEEIDNLQLRQEKIKDFQIEERKKIAIEIEKYKD